jgi:hypothetical protein
MTTGAPSPSTNTGDFVLMEGNATATAKLYMNLNDQYPSGVLPIRRTAPDAPSTPGASTSMSPRCGIWCLPAPRPLPAGNINNRLPIMFPYHLEASGTVPNLSP